jgi:hypothetical protein
VRHARQVDDAGVDRAKHEDGDNEWVSFAVATIAGTHGPTNLKRSRSDHRRS